MLRLKCSTRTQERRAALQRKQHGAQPSTQQPDDEDSELQTGDKEAEHPSNDRDALKSKSRTDAERGRPAGRDGALRERALRQVLYSVKDVALPFQLDLHVHHCNKLTQMSLSLSRAHTHKHGEFSASCCSREIHVSVVQGGSLGALALTHTTHVHNTCTNSRSRTCP